MTREQFVERMGWTPPAGWNPGPKLKPPTCIGCPLEKASTYYVPDEIHPQTETLILLQNPGADEEKIGIPACGKTGQVLNEHYIPLAGLKRGAVSVANVLKCRYGSTNDLPDGPTLDAAVKHCTAAHLTIPDETKLVILQGKLALNYASNRLDGPCNKKLLSVLDWRGYELPQTTEANRRYFVTCHTADTFRDTTVRWVSDLDWRRAGELANTGKRRATPPRQYVAPTGVVSGDTEAFFDRAERLGKLLVIDTEFVPGTTCLTILGIGVCLSQDERLSAEGVVSADTQARHSSVGNTGHSTGNGSAILEVLSVDWSNSEATVKHYVKWRLGKLVRRLATVFHNAQADIPVLAGACHIELGAYAQIEDTMLAHAILWSELPHTLEFCASVYGEYGKFKHLRDEDQIRYNYGDVVDTYSVWKGLVAGFKADPLAEKVYREQSLKLIPILVKAGQQGIRVNAERVVAVFQEYAGVIKKVKDYAELSVGYPINLNSGQQLKHYLYTERRLPLQIDKDSKRPTTNDDAVARLRGIVGPLFDPNRSLTFDKSDEKHYSVLERVAAGADPILESRALWAGIWQVVNNYIIGLAKGVYGESENKRKKARAKYWNEGLTRADIVDRIYPNFAVHAQKTGRWSTTDPPLAQLPADLRDIVAPDPDELCISWDWSAIEPRVLQALTGSQLLKKTFDDNFDLHTWTVCYMFGYEFPPDLVDPHTSASCEAWRARYSWKGKDDPRRVFAKQGRYEMWYGGSGSNAAQAAAQFGLNATDLRVALAKLATSDPAYYTWKVKTEAEVKRTALVRTFMGRPRRFLSSGDSRRREGLDQPMQGAVSDIFNTTVVELASRFPFLRWGWGMHDSQKWYVKKVDLTPTLFEAIRHTVERAYTINQQLTKFPADFEIILPPESGNLKLKPQKYFQGGYA